MAIRNLNWYNLQATRRYPLDDTATGETDTGLDTPNDIIADCHLRFSSALGEYAYIQAINISPNIVTLVVGVSANLFTAGTSVATISLPRPISINTNYAVNALVPGVAGWLVFGNGVLGNTFNGRYSAPQQSLFAPRCARSYRPLPIPSIKKQTLAAELSGVVNLVTNTPVTASYETVQLVDGTDVKAIVLSLDQTDASLSYNPLQFFVSLCGQRPESGTCPKPAIQSINGIKPDCQGNLTIAFENIPVNMFKDCGGMDLVIDYGLNAACTGSPPLPQFYTDNCCPKRFDVIADRDAEADSGFKLDDIVRIGTKPGPYTYFKVLAIDAVTGAITWDALSANDTDVKAALATCEWPDPTELLVTDTPIAPFTQDWPLVELPACADFCSCDTEPAMFETKNGVFIGQRTFAPMGCAPCGGDPVVVPTNTYADSIALTDHYTYLATDSGTVAISTFKNAASDWAFGKHIVTQLKIGPGGVERNGGIVINYRQQTFGNNTQIRYFAAVLDIGKGRARLLEYTNSSFVVRSYVELPLKTNQWYELGVQPTLLGLTVRINVTISEMTLDNPVTASFYYNVPLSEYEPQTGLFGLYADRSYTNFNKFTISE